VTDSERARFWTACGATAAETAELTAYARSGFDAAQFDRPFECPLPDEPFVTAWEEYIARAGHIGAIASLRRALIQLRFPIREGMSGDADYLAAVRRGAWSGDIDGAEGVRFAQPGAIRLFMHETAAGRVPVVVAGAREDFVALVQALTRRNEPTPIPDAMGACIIAGYNDWERIAALGAAFPALAGDKSLYQDRFILLSSGPYSGVPAEDVGVADATWRSMSVTIRLEHECAHFVTRQALGTMRNSMLDEVIADHAGIVAARRRYRAQWFLRFVGLDTPEGCRPDGRIHTYRGAPPLSDGAFAVLQQAVRAVAATLETFDAGRAADERSPLDTARTIVALARVGLEGLAGADAIDRLHAALADASRTVIPRASVASIA